MSTHILVNSNIILLIVLDQPVVDYREYYKIQTEQNDKELKDSLKENFPGQFDGYLNDFNEFNNQDLCSSYYSSTKSSKFNNAWN